MSTIDAAAEALLQYDHCEAAKLPFHLSKSVAYPEGVGVGDDGPQSPKLVTKFVKTFENVFCA